MMMMMMMMMTMREVAVYTKGDPRPVLAAVGCFLDVVMSRPGPHSCGHPWGEQQRRDRRRGQVLAVVGILGGRLTTRMLVEALHVVLVRLSVVTDWLWRLFRPNHIQ